MTANEVSLAPAALREMRWWDIAAVAEIEGLVFPDTAWSAETFWAELARVPDSRAYYIAETDDQVVGYAGVMTTGVDADIQTIAVSPQCRGNGIGDLLMRRLLRTAESRECSRVFLEVAAENEAAIALYLRWDFEVTATRTAYYGPDMDALIMRRSLGREAVL